MSCCTGCSVLASAYVLMYLYSASQLVLKLGYSKSVQQAAAVLNMISNS